jgi:hypothetical protein
MLCFHICFLIEDMELKMESPNASPINNSTSTIDTQGDVQQLVQRTTCRLQSSHTVLTEVVN